MTGDIGVFLSCMGALGTLTGIIIASWRRESNTREIVKDHEDRIRTVENRTNSGEIKTQNVVESIGRVEQKVDKIFDFLIKPNGGQNGK